MKKILIALLFLPFIAHTQTYQVPRVQPSRGAPYIEVPAPQGMILIDSVAMFKKGINLNMRTLYPALRYLNLGSDSGFYYTNGNYGSWFKIGSGSGGSNIGIVSTIAQLPISAELVGKQVAIVTDTLRGGMFNRHPASEALPVDNGVVFPADGGDFWVRVITPSSMLNIQWWGAKGDSSTDNSTTIQLAIDFASFYNLGNQVLVPPGQFICGNLILRNKVRLTGVNGYSTDLNTDHTASQLIRKIGADAILTPRWNCSVAYLEFNGNGGDNIYGPTDSTGGGDGIDLDDSSRSFNMDYCKVYYCNIGLNGHYESGTRITNCDFRNNKAGLINITDGSVINTQFSGNKQKGAYLNGGQWRFIGCFFEFTGYADTSGYGAVVAANATRGQFIGCTWDRNSGNDIYIQGGANNIVIAGGNHFKRAAWASDLTSTQQAAIFIRHSYNVEISGNEFWANDFGASNIAGIYSPLYAIATDSSNDITIIGNKYEVKQKIDLQNGTYVWVASSTPNEYYLRRSNTSVTGNPETGQPDYIGYDSAFLTAGTISSLSAGQWAWGDIDGLGYSTTYVRLTGSTNPSSLPINYFYAYFDHKPYYIDNLTTNVQIDGARDILTGTYVSLAVGDTTTFWLQTRYQTTASRADGYLFQISGRERTANNQGLFTVGLSIDRNSATVVGTVKIGAVQALISDFTCGTTAADGLQIISAAPDGIGTKIKIQIKNNTTHTVDFSAKLVQ